ncbi:MBL fold metallo-hydrolase [Bacillus tuaregi]|uniref:MBL fold metallo-hydrolase n=1 Tax=Bacillus tuaregi TaxID=1816695 RepID=UPI0008F86098|nr:MBL fold metallo-hydrolase [Bacillus tuaregi]
MQLEWVNHASFVLEQDDIRIISDPWLEGKVFDNGWSLMSKTKFSYEDFKHITHIWFSHEHPDHFYPPNIKKIPAEYRKRITVLFQKTKDKKVVNFCKELGFLDVIELIPYKKYMLADDFHIICATFGHDSWMCYKTSTATIVNINDCEFSTQEQLRDISRQVGKVDLLLTQFSFAGYPGNEQSAKNKREKLKMQAEVLQPQFLIPFASFVWFCHEENYYMNKAVNKIGDIHRFIQEQTSAFPIILYPGDNWSLFSEHDSHTSIMKYNQDYKRIEESPELVKTNTVDPSVLRETFEEFVQEFKKKNNLYLVKLLIVRKPTNIYLTDYKKAYKASVLEGVFEESNVSIQECDVALSSEALQFCFKYPWGWDTLNINGRFQTPEQGNIMTFKSIGNIQLRNSHGEYYTALYLLGKIKTRMARKLKRLS